MRKGWQIAPLGKFIKQSKKKVKVIEGNEYPAIGVMMEGRGFVTRPPFIGGVTTYKQLTPVEPNQLVLRSITAWEAPIQVTTQEHVGFHVSGVFPVFDIDATNLNPGFLSLLCQFNPFWESMRERTVGSVLRRKTLSATALMEIPILLPPLPEQKRIADLISSVDSYIEALQKQLESAKKSRNAVLHELLTVSGDDWEKTTLGDIANWSGGITPSMANLEFWEGGNIPWISSGDIATYESEGTKKNVTQKALSDTSLKLLPSGTVIVVVRSGILLHSLPVAILRAPATINQDIKAAQPKKGVKPEFLWFLLRYLEKEILSTCRKTGTTVQSIGTEALLGTKIKLPPMSVQESICEVVLAMDLVTNQSEKLIIEAKNLRSGLLSDLLNGVHEIPASYDKAMGAA